MKLTVVLEGSMMGVRLETARGVVIVEDTGGMQPTGGVCTWDFALDQPLVEDGVALSRVKVELVTARVEP